MPSPLSILFRIFLFAPLCAFATADSFSITLDGTDAELLLKDKIDPIEIIEFSSDLGNWIPVARNYGDQWETVFPHAYALSAVAGSTDQAMVMAKGEKGFYRKRSTSTINASSNRELASRFLMQATFGPSRAGIDNFPNINSNTFGSPGDDSFLDWIDASIQSRKLSSPGDPKVFEFILGKLSIPARDGPKVACIKKRDANSRLELAFIVLVERFR